MKWTSIRDNYRWRNPEKLIIHINGNLAKDPSKPDLYIARAKYWIELKLLELAEADYTQAIEVSCNCAEAYNSRAKIRYQRGDIRAAIEDVVYAAKISNNPQLYLTLGLLQYECEEYRNAMLSLNRAIRLEPQNIPSYYYRMSAQIKLGDYQSAYADLRIWLKLIGDWIRKP
jgi:tetratricopeptide (TPR) repeat protein